MKEPVSILSAPYFRLDSMNIVILNKINHGFRLMHACPYQKFTTELMKLAGLKNTNVQARL